MCKNIRAFHLTKVKLPSRILVSKTPARPKKTTFSIKSMSVSNNIRCQAGRCQLIWVSVCQSIWMVIGWWIELLSKQIPRQRAQGQIPGSTALLSPLCCKISESEGEDSPGQYLQGVLWPPLQQTLCFWALFKWASRQDSALTSVRRWTKVCSRNKGFICWKEVSALSRRSGDSTLKAQPPVAELWSRVWAAIIKTNRPGPQLAQSRRNSAH